MERDTGYLRSALSVVSIGTLVQVGNPQVVHAMSSLHLMISYAAAGKLIYWTVRLTGEAGLGLTVIPTLSVSLSVPTILLASLLLSDSTSS